MKSIAVLLSVHNRCAHTHKCLSQLYKASLPSNYNLHIYITDDGCTDGTTEMINKLYPNINLIKGDGNLFWNRGMYTAWNEAAKKDYDFYLWLNDDTFVYPNILSSLLQASQCNNHQAIIVGATQSTDHQRTTYGGRLSNGEIPKPNGRLIPVHHFNGNIVLVPKFVYQRLGNLDYHFTHSKGDFDYGLRARKAGIKVFQAGTFLGECESHESLDKWCNPEVAFKQRWKMLHRPNGMPPKETFYFERRHWGVISAIFHFLTIYLRCIFPKLWIK